MLNSQWLNSRIDLANRQSFYVLAIDNTSTVDVVAAARIKNLARLMRRRIC